MSYFAENNSKLPVFIGVTGHRDFRQNEEDIVQLKQAIKEIFEEIKRGFDSTEFVLLTALAAGADQFVAEAAVANGMRYAVVLPMPRDEYLNRNVRGTPDFTPEQKANAIRLMEDTEHCMFVYEIPRLLDTDNDEKQFREAARFISDSSCAGIALWDGRMAQNAHAGTGVAVRDSLHGITYRSEYFPGITIPETRPIYHIQTPRCSDPQAPYNFKWRKLFPEPLLETGSTWFNLNRQFEAGDKAVLRAFEQENDWRWQRIGKPREEKVRENLAAIDFYNSNVVKYKKEMDEAFPTAKKYMCGGIPAEGTRSALCSDYFASADSLAMLYQKRRQRSGILIILLAGLSYAVLNAFSDLLKYPPFLLLYILLLCATICIWRHIDKKRYHEQFVSYRALAEGLRVQFFWHAADVTSNGLSAQAQDYYLRRQKSRIEWVRYAIRVINLMSIAEYPAVAADLKAVKNVSDEWLGKMDIYNKGRDAWEYPTAKIASNGQSGYYLSKSIKNRNEIIKRADIPVTRERKSKLFRRSRIIGFFAGACIALSFAIVFFMMICFGVNKETGWILSEYKLGTIELGDVAMFLSGLLPIIAMVLREINNFKGYSDDVDRYTWYYKVFKRAIIEIDECDRDTGSDLPDDASKCSAIKYKLFEIGKESLVENADWVMLNEKRAPEVPSN